MSNTKKTFQQQLSNQDIKDMLKEYKQVSDVRKVPIGTHLRYFSFDPKTKENKFRMGGTLQKTDPEGRYLMLSNGKDLTWSVQIPNTSFYQKLSQTELKKEIKEEIRKEVQTEYDADESELKKYVKQLEKEIGQYKDIEKKYVSLHEKYEKMVNQMALIQNEVLKKKKEKKENKENK